MSVLIFRKPFLLTISFIDSGIAWRNWVNVSRIFSVIATHVLSKNALCFEISFSQLSTLLSSTAPAASCSKNIAENFLPLAFYRPVKVFLFLGRYQAESQNIFLLINFARALFRIFHRSP